MPGLATPVGEVPTFGDATDQLGLSYVQRLESDDCEDFNPNCGLAKTTGGVAVADYDGDGDPDLYVTRYGLRDYLFQNQGQGAFLEVGVAAGLDQELRTNGATFADVDADGDLDLYVTSMLEDQFFLHMNQGDGTFVEEARSRGAALADTVTRRGSSATFGDFDRDGYLDLHVTEFQFINPAEKTHNRLLRNLGKDGPGYFEDVTEQAGVLIDALHEQGSFGYTSAFSDLDEDGWPDLVITADHGSSRIFWNQADGTFVDGTESAGLGSETNGMGHTFGDYDGDGRLDLFVTSIEEPNSCVLDDCWNVVTGNRLYRNNGDRTFRDDTDRAGVRAGGWAWGTSFFDMDNDGRQDLVLTSGMDFLWAGYDYRLDPMRLWHSRGAGRLEEVSFEAGLTDRQLGKGLVVFDFDQDGDLDLFVANNAQKPRLYRNDGGNRMDWLRVNLKGRTNRQGIGARLALYATDGGPAQVREILAGGVFLGQNEVTAHFGLGPEAQTLARLEVRWPDGTLQTLRDIEPGQLLVVEQP